MVTNNLIAQSHTLKVLLFRSSGGPQTARGSIIGNINDIEFGIAILNATITDSKSGSKVIKAAISNVPRALGQSHDLDISIPFQLLFVSYSVPIVISMGF